jgi:thiol-disulfide isomerase/thioredoxin
MRRRRSYVLAGMAAIAAGVGFSIWRERAFERSQSQAEGPAAGQGPVGSAGVTRSIGEPSDAAVMQLFALELTGPGGEPVPMQQFRDRRLVVNFWATWCAPCVEEMPELSGMAEEFAGKGVTFVGIAIDQVPNVARFIQKLPVRYPIAVAGAAGIGMVTALGNPQGGLPFTVVLEADGRIRERYLGKVVMAELRQVLTS